MGEDIHFRMYLKRRRDGKYVNAHEVCEWNPKGSVFDEFVSGRNYDVFSLFGSGRGNYKPLPNAEYGMPEFLVGTDFDEYCKDCGFYGFVWFKAPVLEKSLRGFIERLLDPLKYLDEDTDEYLDWKELRSAGNKTAKQMQKLHDMYTAWYDEHFMMLSVANKLHMNIKHFVSIYCPSEQECDPYCDPAPNYRYYENSLYNKMFDMQETVFLFFFDN